MNDNLDSVGDLVGQPVNPSKSNFWDWASPTGSREEGCRLVTAVPPMPLRRLCKLDSKNRHLAEETTSEYGFDFDERPDL